MKRLTLALAAPATSGARSCASPQVTNPEEQIARALVAAPEDKAAGARIPGYASDGAVVELRAGSNMIVPARSG